MVPLPWKTFRPATGDKDYVALLSYLPLKHYRMVPKFFWLTVQTQRQLAQSKGLVGYSLLAKPMQRQFWTLSAWEDQESLMDFVQQIPHSKIMQTLAPHMGKTRFVQWKVKAQEIPLQWEQARARMS